MGIHLRIIRLIVAAAILSTIVENSIAASTSEINKDKQGVAIKGFDPVAFYTDGKPVLGSDKYEIEWKNARWRFSSAEHRDLFKANPENYAPRYGGYCAWAVSKGYTADVDPKNAWSIVDGKLYLNYNAKVKKKWEQDIPGNINKADANWPGVLD